MLISAVQQSDSVIHIYILFHILFRYGLSQDIEYSSLCYTVGPCCLSVLYITACVCSSHTPSPFFPQPPSPLATTSLFSVFVQTPRFLMFTDSLRLPSLFPLCPRPEKPITKSVVLWHQFHIPATQAPVCVQNSYPGPTPDKDSLLDQRIFGSDPKPSPGPICVVPCEIQFYQKPCCVS